MTHRENLNGRLTRLERAVGRSAGCPCGTLCFRGTDHLRHDAGARPLAAYSLQRRVTGRLSSGFVR